MMRTAGRTTDAGRAWFARLVAAQQTVEEAERARDELARQALDEGLGVRGTAKALGVDKSTVVRRYGGRTAA